MFGIPVRKIMYIEISATLLCPCVLNQYQTGQEESPIVSTKVNGPYSYVI